MSQKHGVELRIPSRNISSSKLAGSRAMIYGVWETEYFPLTSNANLGEITKCGVTIFSRRRLRGSRGRLGLHQRPSPCSTLLRFFSFVLCASKYCQVSG